jgi:hypothetical protein
MRKPVAQSNGLERLSSQPFLTDDQRAALDAALAKKRAEQPPPPAVSDTDAAATSIATKPHLSGKSAYVERPKTRREQEHDAHLSRRGRGLGRTKKGGAGGKYTWGTLDPYAADGSLDAATQPLDKGDPNYDSDLDESIALVEEASASLADYKRSTIELLEEYYNSGDASEASLTLKELDRPQLSHWFVKKALTLALDRHDREREATSVLLSNLYSTTISSYQLRVGFSEAIGLLDDTILDVPDAPNLMSLFTCRAIADDVLSPSFVHNIEVEEGLQDSVIADFKNKCETILSDKHFSERMQRCWGIQGAGVRLAETKASIAAALKEFRESGDVAEVGHLLRSLAVPFFHHELVKQALLMSMEAPSSDGDPVGKSGNVARWQDLLDSLATTGLVSVSQMTKGFQRVADSIADVELDNPKARAYFAEFVAVGKSKGWVEQEFSFKQNQQGGREGNGVAANNRPTTPPIVNGIIAPYDHHHPSVAAYKKAVLTAVREYFESGDVEEVMRQLAELNEPAFAHIFIKHAVTAAMDRKDRERELISVLLPQLIPTDHLIPQDQADAGFIRLLVAADDLTLDIPDAAHMLSLFLSRAIADEVLPPRFLTEALAHIPAGSLGVEVVQAAGGMLTARHAGERLAYCWHPSAGGGIDALADAVHDILAEFKISGDGVEAERCILELGAPHFQHELVYQAIIDAFSDDSTTTTTNGGSKEHGVPTSLQLLARLAASGEVSQTQIVYGFDRVEADLDDLKLDYIKAPELLRMYKKMAVQGGWLKDE